MVQSLHHDEWSWVTVAFPENTDALHPYAELLTFWDNPKFPDPLGKLEKGLPRSAGHRQGAEAARRVIQAAPALGIHTLTLFALSSANWQRPAAEVSAILTSLFATAAGAMHIEIELVLSNAERQISGLIIIDGCRAAQDQQDCKQRNQFVVPESAKQIVQTLEQGT